MEKKPARVQCLFSLSTKCAHILGEDSEVSYQNEAQPGSHMCWHCKMV